MRTRRSRSSSIALNSKAVRPCAIESVIQSVSPAAGSEGMSGTSNPPATVGDATASSNVPAGSNVPTGSMGSTAGADGFRLRRDGLAARHGQCCCQLNQSTTNTAPGSRIQLPRSSQVLLSRAPQPAQPSARQHGGLATAMSPFAPHQSPDYCWQMTSTDCPSPTPRACCSELVATFTWRAEPVSSLAVAMAPQKNGSGMSR